jgi:hypothetical protein
MDVGVVGELDAAGVDHDQPRPAERRLLDARAHDRVTVRRVAAADEDRPGAFDVGEGIRGRARAEHAFSAAALGAWQTRAQQSTSFVPRTTRANFCAT